MKLYAKHALCGGTWQNDLVITVENRTITAVEKGTDGEIRADWLSAGLLDKHQHGGMGFDCTAPESLESCLAWLRLLASHGVTNVLYTLGSGPIEKTRRAVEFAAEVMARQQRGDLPGARVMGVHFEGPFISEKRSGAMNKACIIPPTVENYRALCGGHEDIIRAITLAPEVPGALELTRYLTAAGVKVQAGHTNANYQELQAGVDTGITGLTHTFNAMPGIQHRDPGPIVCGLLDERLCLEAICDLVHLSGPILQLLFKVRGRDGVAIISDSVGTAGLPDGEYFYGNHPVIVKDGRNYTTTGGIAGGYHQMDKGIHSLVSLGIPLADALIAGTRTPFRYLGMADRAGDIAVGHMGCLSAWREDGTCVFGFDGETLFENK